MSEHSMRKQKQQQFATGQHIALASLLFVGAMVFSFSYWMQSIHASSAVGTTTLVGVNDFFCQPSVVGAVSGNFVTVGGTHYTNVTTVEVLVYSENDADFILTGVDVVGSPGGSVTAGNSTLVEVTITAGDGLKDINLETEEQGGPGWCFSQTQVFLDQTAPSIASPIKPGDQTKISGPTTIDFIWQQSIDSGVGMGDYQLFISADINFPGGETYTTITTNTGVSLNNPTYLRGDQLWRVSATDLLGNSSMSNIFGFEYELPETGSSDICGNGELEAGEECDDGNNVDNDGCSMTCEVEATYCGDGVVNQVSEECDDGNNSNDDYCANDCTLLGCYEWTEDIGEACSDYDGNVIYFLLDQSASMQGTKLDATKQAAKDFINQLTPGQVSNGEVTEGSVVGLITFNQQGNIQVSPPTSNFSQVITKIDSFSAQGYSNFADPIDIATTHLENNFTNTPKHYIFLADGLPTNPAPDAGAQAIQAASNAKNQQIDITTVGLQADSSTSQLLKNIGSSLSQFHYANSPSQLSLIFNQILAELICDEATAPQYINMCPDECDSLTVDWTRDSESSYQVDVLRCSGVGEGDYHIEIFDQQDNLVEEFMAATQDPDGWTFSPQVPFSLPFEDYTVTCTVGATTNEACTQTIQGGVCGDGYVDPGEACDDGNNNNTDSCTNECQPPQETECGNGIIESGESCDDGNTQSGDGCSSSCQDETSGFCGDGIVSPTEECDDGNLYDNDGCTNSCEIGNVSEPVCGNGQLEQGELCDDGNTQNGDGCTSTCTFENTSQPICGNGILEIREQCDDGNTQNGDGCSSTCRYDDMKEPVCGNGILEIDEQCDDNNTQDNDGCDSSCQIEGDGPICGNGILENSEQCDDGNGSDNDGCSSICQVVPALIGACGNGKVEPGEVCDDGNIQNGDGCSSHCKFENIDQPVCSNGILEVNEECDDGNTINGDGCSATCEIQPIALPECGDGVLEAWEQCDDGNTQNGDGCSAECTSESVATCGDGILNQVSEECDDGNNVNGDGCSSACQAEGTIIIKIKKDPPEDEDDDPDDEGDDDSGDDESGKDDPFNTQGDGSPDGDKLPTVDDLQGSQGDGSDGQDGTAQDSQTHAAPKGLGSEQFMQKKMAVQGLYIFWVLVYDIETFRVWYNTWLFANPEVLPNGKVVYQFPKDNSLTTDNVNTNT